jgi:G:T/U-mismatch repair DNA glycosylase
MIKSNHQYIDKNPVKATDSALILGTIHPHRTDDFIIDFFYGNKNSLWNILGLAFPNLDLRSVEKIQATLAKSNIWVSDMIRTCEREHEKITQDRLLNGIAFNKDQIETGIKNSKIETIFFTSGFGKNNAAKLFCEAFSINVPNKKEREFDIEEHFFGKKIKGLILFSPSGQANIGISKNKLFLQEKEKYTSSTPVNEFKIATYKESFKDYFGNQ